MTGQLIPTGYSRFTDSVVSDHNRHLAPHTDFQNQLVVRLCATLLQSRCFSHNHLQLQNASGAVPPPPGEIEFIAAVSFLKCSVQQDQRPIERGRFNQIPAVLFLLPRCFPIQIAFISETFPPMVFMIVHKSHLLVEWTRGKLQGASSVFSALFTWSLIVS